jgi:hypothetical protein
MATQAPNPVETFLDTIRKGYNKIVKEDFVDGSDDSYTSTNPVNALRHAFTLFDSDTLALATAKMLAFYIFRMDKKVQYLEGLILPSDTWGDIEDRPKITLIFTQKNYQTLKKPLIAELTFRLKKETEDLTSSSEAEYARELRSNFPLSFSYTSGPSCYHYEDRKNGYRNNIWCNTKNDGESVIRRMLAIQDIPFNEDYVRYRTGSKVRDRTSTYKGVTRKITDKKTSRGEMVLRSATLHPGGGWKPVVLFSR